MEEPEGEGSADVYTFPDTVLYPLHDGNTNTNADLNADADGDLDAKSYTNGNGSYVYTDVDKHAGNTDQYSGAADEYTVFDGDQHASAANSDTNAGLRGYIPRAESDRQHRYGSPDAGVCPVGPSTELLI